MEPKILFEDEDLLVLDKPAGMVVNRAESVKVETVEDWLMAYGRWLMVGSQIVRRVDFYGRAGIVHRLDKETSGLLLVAKTPEAFEDLQRQFKERKVEKVYVALVHGRIFPKDGVINAPVGRLPWNRERFGVLPGGRNAETHYRVDSYYSLSTNHYSLITLIPKTGRTHQIRVHLKSIGHPIVSDEFYAGRKTARQDRTWCSRVFLHAQSITFTHPKSRQRVLFASELPPELRTALAQLKVLK